MSLLVIVLTNALKESRMERAVLSIHRCLNVTRSYYYCVSTNEQLRVEFYWISPAFPMELIVSQVSWSSFFFQVSPEVSFPDASGKGVTKEHATITNTNHRRDIYFLLFRGNRATRILFSNWKPPADGGFLFSASPFHQATPHAPFLLPRVNLPPSCHVSINGIGLESLRDTSLIISLGIG